MLIARAAANAPRRIHFADIADALTRLLKEFGPSRTQHHPEFPFWQLQTDGFWTIEHRRNFPLKPRGRSPARRILIENDAVGAVPKTSGKLSDAARRYARNSRSSYWMNSWPSTLHTAIRQAIGLPQPTGRSHRNDPTGYASAALREEILRAYQRRCAVSGYDGRLADVSLGLEAAHVKWHAYQGPDQVDNGVALAPFTIWHWTPALWDSVTICAFLSPAMSMVKL